MEYTVLSILLSLALFLPTECSPVKKEKLKNYGSDTITDYTLKQLLEKLRSMAGQKQLIPNQRIFINQTEMLLNASFTNGSISDLSSFKVDLSHVDMTTLEFFMGISYSTLRIKGDYSVYLDNEYIHMESADQLSVDINNMALKVYLKLNLTKDQTLQLENVVLDYNMTVKVDIRYLGGDQQVSDTLNQLINDVMPDTIQSTRPDVQKMVKEAAIERSRFFLDGMTVQEFVDYINSFVNS